MSTRDDTHTPRRGTAAVSTAPVVIEARGVEKTFRIPQ
jgi:hypothetical protein